VCIDGCKEGLGGVLMQDNHMVSYEFRKLKELERNYVIHDLKLVVAMHALKMWHHYLMGRRFILMMDCNGLKYIFDQPNLNARQAI